MIQPQNRASTGTRPQSFNTKSIIAMAYSFSIIRSQRKTVAIEITKEAQVLVRAPQRMSERAIEAFVHEKEAWIQKNVCRMRERRRKLASELEREPQSGKMTEVSRQAIAARACELFPARAGYFAEKMQVEYGRISLRWQRTRWGSCSAKGNLNFNCLLVLAPPEVLDYVVVHELCHRREMNHSRRFWAEVERVLPEYRTARAWLKEHGEALMAQGGNI